jgi:hypothetical protein
MISPAPVVQFGTFPDPGRSGSFLQHDIFGEPGWRACLAVCTRAGTFTRWQPGFQTTHTGSIRSRHGSRVRAEPLARRWPPLAHGEPPALGLDGIDQAPFVRRREISNTPEHTTAALREDGVRPRLPSAAFETAFFAAAARLQPERPAVITGYR